MKKSLSFALITATALLTACASTGQSGHSEHFSKLTKHFKKSSTEHESTGHFSKFKEHFKKSSSSTEHLDKSSTGRFSQFHQSTQVYKQELAKERVAAVSGAERTEHQPLKLQETSAKYLCSYTARINPEDKVDDNGNLFTTVSDNRSIVASILRQDRLKKVDSADENDCYFTPRNYSRMQYMLQVGAISQEDINTILNGNPTVQVDIYKGLVQVAVVN